MSSTPLMAVKFVEGSDSQIEGLAIPFGGPAYLGGKDLQGEKFDAETDLALEWFPAEGRPFLFGHGMDPEIKATVVGRQIERTVTDLGHWVKVQLDKRSKYLDHLRQLVANDALFFSSGAVPHLVEVDEGGRIKSWPWVELSGTPTPANPDAAVYAVKAADAIEHLAAIRTDVPAALKESTSEHGLEFEPFAVHAERITSDVSALADRAEHRRETRVKAGRELSAPNRAELQEVIDAIDRLTERRARIADLLTRSDPQAAEAAAAKAAEARALEAEYLRIESRLLGVPV